ncbi:MAG: hypothetical protein RBT49_11890 [Bacteroidales bacterium]|jgi:hypothetical protein|nr:hypothetical protein [Bacteroidales bacterium]
MIEKRQISRKTKVSKKITDIGHPYYKLGRLNKTVADKAKIKAADIYIDRNHILHIQKEHAKELESLGIKALDFVQTIVNNYNQIRKGTGDSILLIVYHNDLHNTAAMQLNYAVDKEFWEVKTAQPRKTSKLRGVEILLEIKKE